MDTTAVCNIMLNSLDPDYREVLHEAQKRKRDDADFLQSTRLDLPAPKITADVIAHSMKFGGPWRPLGTAAAEKAAAEEAAEKARWEVELVEIPEAEF